MYMYLIILVLSFSFLTKMSIKPLKKVLRIKQTVGKNDKQKSRLALNHCEFGPDVTVQTAYLDTKKVNSSG